MRVALQPALRAWLVSWARGRGLSLGSAAVEVLEQGRRKLEADARKREVRLARLSPEARSAAASQAARARWHQP